MNSVLPIRSKNAKLLCDVIADALKKVRDRINNSAVKAGRNPEEIKLIAVSKTVDLQKIIEAVKAGATIMGENRVQEAKTKIKNMGAGANTPAPINYETALPQGVGKLVQQEDGSMVLANEHDQGFMVNQAIVDFWKSCNGQRKVTDLVELFAQQTGLQRKQVEKEVMQLLQQLRDGGLIAIAGQPDSPNVEFKKN